MENINVSLVYGGLKLLWVNGGSNALKFMMAAMGRILLGQRPKDQILKIDIILKF